MKIMRKTIINDEQFLRQVSEYVNFNDKSYLEDIEKLKEFCHKDGIFALAPVQIGIAKRIIYLRSTSTDLNKINDSNYDESRVLINPVIIKRKGLTKYLEACASCPDPLSISEDFNNDEKYLSCVVERPYVIEIEYYDINGNKKNETFKGFESTVLSHEYDHLNGVLHIDHSKEVMSLDLDGRVKYRESHPYEVVSEDCDYDNR